MIIQQTVTIRRRYTHSTYLWVWFVTIGDALPIYTSLYFSEKRKCELGSLITKNEADEDVEGSCNGEEIGDNERKQEIKMNIQYL